LAWSIVPGLGHLKTNRFRLGRAILIIWLILLAMTVLSIGTTWTWLLVSGMVVTHAVAVLSLFAANLAYERLIVRAAFGALLFFCLNLFVYDPARWLCTRFVSTLVISNEPDGSVARQGDGLLVAGPWLRPDSFERGDLVVCRIQGYVSSGYVIRPGYNVDRVVGVPGDRIQLKGGVLLVNGTSPPKGERPLGEVPLGTLELVLGHDEYLVLPSFLRREALIHVGPLGVALPGPDLQRTLPAPVIRRLTLFQGEEVLGRVLLRLRPLSRFGRLE
jgi:signal peptidase I